MNPIELVLLQPAKSVFIAASSILVLWGAIYLGAILFFRKMEILPIVKDEPHSFGFRRISPSGKRYEWFVKGHWLNAREFEIYCTEILDLTREQLEKEFGWLDKAQPPLL